MKFLSVCSGIESASVAWEPLGWEALAFAEIEKFPSAVLAHHWPDVPNLGDMTKHHEWPNTLRPDIIVGGTPCQSFSVAGLRKGLADPRGNLTLVFLGLLDQYRPAWMVWENVPGVLSDKTGAFGSFLGGLGELGYGFAYRVLDAQYFGVPQRRRRVFVVGHLGDWRRAAAVLFERESLCGNPPPSRKAGKGIAAGFECGPQGGGFTDLAPTLDTRCKDGPIRNQLGAGVISPAVTSKWAKGSGGPSGDECQNLIAAHTTGAGFWQEGFGTLRGREQDSHENLIAHSLLAEGFDASEDGTGRGTPLVPVAFAIQDGALRENPGSGPQGKGYQEHLAYTLEARGAMSKQQCVASAAVRRLTPRECERLQGFPDHHTLIPWRNKPADQCPDGPRYKALGNSMAVPVMRWIGERIQIVDAIGKESL